MVDVKSVITKRW